MDQSPDFYLTAAGEYSPMAEPRACWVTRRLLDSEDTDYLVVRIEPPFHPTDAPASEVSHVIMTARHRGESVARISSWPIYVYIGQILDDSIFETERLDKSQCRIIAWARLYPRVEDAIHDSETHAAALRVARSSESVYAQEVRFLAEQDGVPERTLKRDLSTLFSADERIWKAYLARVDLGLGTPMRVALCIRTVMGADSTIVGKVAEVFAPLFRTQESLDILFIDNVQEQELANVCKPFYVRKASRYI